MSGALGEWAHCAHRPLSPGAQGRPWQGQARPMTPDPLPHTTCRPAPSGACLREAARPLAVQKCMHEAQSS